MVDEPTCSDAICIGKKCCVVVLSLYISVVNFLYITLM